MAPVIATSPRLTLQVLSVEEHLQALYEQESHPLSGKWSSRTRPTSIEATLQMVNSRRPTPEKPWSQTWAICLKPEDPTADPGSGKFIGSMGLPRECDVGYSIHPDHWGKGYMTEALRMFVDMFFRAEEYKQYDRMCGHADPANLASNRVLQKAGAVKGQYKKELFESASNPGVKLDLQEWVFMRPTS